MEYNILLRTVLSRGYTESVLGIMLDQYEHLNVLMRQDDMIRIIE